MRLLSLSAGVIALIVCVASLPKGTCFVRGPVSRPPLGASSSLQRAASSRCREAGEGCIAAGPLLPGIGAMRLARFGGVSLRALEGDGGAAAAAGAAGGGEAEAGGGGGAEEEAGDRAWAEEEQGDKPLNRKERRRLNRTLRSRDRNRLTGEGDTSISRNKALSQNLLVDPMTIDRMVMSVADTSPDGRCVVELGPGLGALTGPLMEDYPGMTAVELDPHACEELRKSMPSLNLVEGSLLDFDFAAHSEAMGGRLTVISNLPFGITSSALFHMLDNSEYIQRAVLLMQQEAADRILCDMSKRKYGTQSIEFALRSSRIQQIAKVPSIAFDPPPKNTKCAMLLVEFEEEPPMPPFEMRVLRQTMQGAFDNKGLPLAATIYKRKALRELVPGIRDYCEGGANWLQKKPSELAPGKWLHAARSLSVFAGGGEEQLEEEEEGEIA
jgi:16S rRNA (adenine1518-N6/adenine1519-N6)-dimethyltransferase